MLSKISLPRLVPIVVVGLIFVSMLVFFIARYLPALGSYAKSDAPSEESISSASSGEERPGLPVRLLIPSINVNAALESVVLTPDGTLGAPEGPTNAGWFSLGPRPGEKGSAVIDGHSGWSRGISAVFDNLSTLKKGDKLYVQDEHGATITFVVRELRVYDRSEDASRVFGSLDGKAYLNLITCEGTWNAKEQNYPNRLVVFTDREM